MKVEYKIHCHEHGDEIIIVDVDVDPIAGKVAEKTVTTYVKACFQCKSESYERGIESVLAKGYSRNMGEE